MAELVIDQDMVEAAVVGGAVLGGGGGGSMDWGRELGQLAVRLGTVRLVNIDNINAEDTIVTVSAVGAPAAKQALVQPVGYIRAVELLMEQAPIIADGLITNECGGTATINGWLQSAVLGIPVIDAPCNGRAHPTGAMGSMGLHAWKDYVSYQAAAGGDPEQGRYLELVVQGEIERVATLVRQAAVQAGGLVAVARNPIAAGYVKENGAPGAIRQSIMLGQAMLAVQSKGGLAVIEAAAEALQGQIVEIGQVEEVELVTAAGFDSGRIMINTLELTFWNEYMTLEREGQRLGTFPDLIATLDKSTGLPLSSADIREQQEVAILYVPRDKLLLGAGMFSAELLAQAEPVVNKQLVNYLQQ
ncbi:MAG: DUF917 family protein [Firmicutes bacterium]|nr:DUF917 family protein [Bacillota bacterium]